MEEVEKKYSSQKILYHPDKLKSFLEEKIIAPIYVRIKPTNRCNHRCFYCSYDPDFKGVLSQRFEKNDEIPREKMMEILSDFKDIGVKALTYSGGGEPTIYPHIIDTMKKTLDYGIELSMITNGQKLSKERAEILTNAEWVRISVDGNNAKTFAKNRRISEKFFYELVDNIKEFAKKKKPTCELGINFVINKINEDEVYSSAKFFKELGVNHIKFTPAWMHDYFGYHENSKNKIMEQIERAKTEFNDSQFNVYDTCENDFKFSGVNERKYNQCFVMQIIPVIGADCNVYFCHDKTYTKNGEIGSIKEKSFKELWFSKEAEEKFKNFNPEKECLQHCTYDSRNILVHEILKNPEKIGKNKLPEVSHKNFI